MAKYRVRTTDHGRIGGFSAEISADGGLTWLCAERADKIERLRDALAAVRVKALPAGASIMRQSEGWEDRCHEVLDIIDTALDERNTV